MKSRPRFRCHPFLWCCWCRIAFRLTATKSNFRTTSKNDVDRNSMFEIESFVMSNFPPILPLRELKFESSRKNCSREGTPDGGLSFFSITPFVAFLPQISDCKSFALKKLCFQLGRLVTLVLI